MKRLTLLTSSLLLSTTTLFAQSKTEPKTAPTKPQYQKVKVLPPLATIKLTPAQIMRIDSAISVINNAVDSKNTSKWIITSFEPIFNQANKQLLTDSVKVDAK